MLTVHHLENSRSQRVLWLLEELGVPYEVKRYERDRKTMLAPAELRAIHPLGKSPVVTDGEQVIAESGAIVEHLVERYGQGRLIPLPNTPERLRYTYWLPYAEDPSARKRERPRRGGLAPSCHASSFFARLMAKLQAIVRRVVQ